MEKDANNSSEAGDICPAYPTNVAHERQLSEGDALMESSQARSDGMKLESCSGASADNAQNSLRQIKAVICRQTGRGIHLNEGSVTMNDNSNTSQD